jgi:hypothetical protein
MLMLEATADKSLWNYFMSFFFCAAGKKHAGDRMYCT